MKSEAKKILKYAILPGIIPMTKEFISSGFAYIAYFMAIVLQSVKLLPATHPYVRATNIGGFGIRHVLAQSGKNLIFDRNHMDQIVVYSALLAGLVLLFMQFCFLIFSLMVGTALAAMPTNYADFFVTANPTHDIAFVLLDRVFGVKDVFESCVEQNVACFNSTVSDGPFPWPYHYALHSMLRLYSVALLVIGALILCYFIITVVAETAQDGTPFGRRFNHVWAPLRLVVAFGLLMPVGTTGLNSAQYITLYSAKWGSGFATNAWILFNDKLTETYLGDKLNLIATPKIPDIERLLQFMLTAQTCRAAHEAAGDPAIAPYLVKSQLAANSSLPYLSTDYDAALKFSNYETMEIRIGYVDKEDFMFEKGFVAPVCGSFLIPVVDLDEPGAQKLLKFYYDQLAKLYTYYESDGETIAKRNWPTGGADVDAAVETNRYDDLQARQALFRTAITESVLKQANSGDFTNTDTLKYGWAGAAIWYNKIAQMNGAVTTAVFNIPRPKLWPSVMEKVSKKRLQHDSKVVSVDRFNRVMADGFSVKFSPARDEQIYDAEYDAYSVFEIEDGGRINDNQISRTGNVVIDLIHFLFGTEGLFNIRENADIHPLAQLSAVGKALIESTIRLVGISAGVGGFLALFDGGMAGLAGNLLLTFAMVGVSAGFALFYVIPFLPFLYFFFSAGGWIKGIFEAMVGVPLWALAHIRIDGEGLAGDAAISGYYLIFEIFLRPILMLFGLLGSILIFAALVRVLNDVFDLVIHNVSGFDLENYKDASLTDPAYYRGAIDQFFFTIIYTIIVYMLGVSSFKMVYLVPNQILRWMGSSVTTFGDTTHDPTQGLMQTVAIGGQDTFHKLGNAAKQGGGGIQSLINMAKNM